MGILPEQAALRTRNPSWTLTFWLCLLLALHHFKFQPTGLLATPGLFFPSVELSSDSSLYLESILLPCLHNHYYPGRPSSPVLVTFFLSFLFSLTYLTTAALLTTHINLRSKFICSYMCVWLVCPPVFLKHHTMGVCTRYLTVLSNLIQSSQQPFQIDMTPSIL